AESTGRGGLATSGLGERGEQAERHRRSEGAESERDERLAQRAEAKRGRAEEPDDAEHREEAEDDGQDRGVVAATHAEEPHVRMRKADWHMNAYAQAAADARGKEQCGTAHSGP